MNGCAKYLDLDSNETIEVQQDDFFVIRPNTKYYQKSCAGTKILFVKVPGGNDKHPVELTDSQRSWGRSYEEDV